MSPKVPELMGAREVADALGVDRRNLYKVSNLPKPAQELRSGPVWAKQDIDKFIVQRKERGL